MIEIEHVHLVASIHDSRRPASRPGIRQRHRLFYLEFKLDRLRSILSEAEQLERLLNEKRKEARRPLACGSLLRFAVGDARPSRLHQVGNFRRERTKQNEKVNKTLRVVVRAWRRQRARDSSYGFVAVLARHVGHHGPSRRLPLCSSRSCLPTSNPSPSRAQAYAPNATDDMQHATCSMPNATHSAQLAPCTIRHAT